MKSQPRVQRAFLSPPLDPRPDVISSHSVPRVTWRRAGATSHSLPGQKLRFESLGTQERVLTPDPRAEQQPGLHLASLGGLGTETFPAGGGTGRAPGCGVGLCESPLSSLCSHQDAGKGAVCRPVNEPQPTGEAVEGQRLFFGSWQG